MFTSLLKSKMLLNRKILPTLFILSVLVVAVLLQRRRSNYPVPFKTESGVFNCSMAFFPSDTDTTEITFSEPKFYSAIDRFIYRKIMYLGFVFGFEWHPIDFLNARTADIDYHVNGFTMVESPIEECDWSVKENREKFYSEFEPIIRKLHPDVTQIYWFDDAFLQRHVNGANEPVINGLHLDYHPNQRISMDWSGYNVSDFDMILGVWKPDNMDTPVVDYPLALVDGTTWGIEDVIPFYGEAEQTTMDGTSELRKFVSSSVLYSPKMKFYYYPEQTSNEVLLFHQYSNEDTVGTFANPHTSFKVPDSPRGAPSRQSVEMRVGLVFEQDEAKTSRIQEMVKKFGIISSE